jgi:predicted metal-binding membrane protein
MTETPQSAVLAPAEPTDSSVEETRRAEHDLVRWIVIGIAIAVPACVAMFMASIWFDVSYESAPLGGPLAMGAAVGVLAGLFFGAWVAFVFKGHTFDELDRKANRRDGRPSHQT